MFLYFDSLCVILFTNAVPNLQHSLPSMSKDNSWRTKRIRFVYINPTVQSAFESAIKMNEKSRSICKNKLRSKKVCTSLILTVTVIFYCGLIKLRQLRVVWHEKLRYIGIGKFHSKLLHRTTRGGQLYTYFRFVPCGSKKISLNCICVLPSTMYTHFTSLLPTWLGLGTLYIC